MGHHGLLVGAKTLEKALWLAIEVETLAKMYVHALAIGEPPRLLGRGDGPGGGADAADVLRPGARLDEVKDTPAAVDASAVAKPRRSKAA